MPIFGGPKLRIRLPDDPGPNPYDSKTPYQKPEHLTLKWWAAIIGAGVGYYLIRKSLGQ
jgi:hypothetical protein